ncbi:hypothetical protein Peur_037646 [Populus x canadensis]
MGGSWIGGRMKHWWCRREPTSVIICCINLHSCSPTTSWFYGVVVSTLDFESSDLGSTPVLRGLLLKDNQTFTHVSNSKRRFHCQTA